MITLIAIAGIDPFYVCFLLSVLYLYTVIVLSFKRRCKKPLRKVRKRRCNRSNIIGPGPFLVKCVGQQFLKKGKSMKSILEYEAELPPNGVVKDLDHRELVLSVDGVLVSTTELNSDTDKVTFKVPQDSSVHLKLFNVDDSGNRSTPSEQVFVARDTIPPDAPGAFGAITLLNEEVIPDSPAPVDPAPVEDAPAPVDPAPVEDAPAPVEDAPAPVDPAPVADTDPE